MVSNIRDFPEFNRAIREDSLVYLFGTGISAALTGERYSWYKWINEGLDHMSEKVLSDQYRNALDSDPSVDTMIDCAGKIIAAAKTDGTYDSWMKESFESNALTNDILAKTLKKMLRLQDVFATTNYDLLLERATGLATQTYENPDVAFKMLDEKTSTHVLHIHGAYDSLTGLDNIVAGREQYEAVLSDEGAQFIQHILGTRTLIFVGCGQTTEDPNIAKFIQFAKMYLKLDREYYFLCKSGQSFDGMPENIRLISYGSDYDDLQPFLDQMARERISYRMLQNPLVLRTIYSENKADPYGLDKYYFANEYLKFCGRGTEISRLLNFLETDKPFCWWAVTGQAGSGKSRLAFELLRRMPQDFLGFFLNHDADEKYIDEYIPGGHTLVVIDYVKDSEDIIARFVGHFIERFSGLRYKLRILFLERDNVLLSGSWYDKLEKSIGVLYRGIFRDCEYNADIALRRHRFLYLDDLGIDAVDELIGDICSKKNLPEDSYRDKNLREQYTSKFEKLKYRPLFLQMFVEAWVDNGCVAVEYQKYEDLLDAVIKRELERIEGSVNHEADTANALIRMILRANISGELNLSSVTEYYKIDWEQVRGFVKRNTIAGKFRKEYIQSLLSDATQELTSDTEIIRPLYPDIIKEYMFLCCTDEEELPELSEELWSDCPGDYNLFLSRCVLDFIDNAKLVDFIRNVSADYMNLNAVQVRLSLLRYEVIHDLEEGDRLWDELAVEFSYWRNAPEAIEHEYRVALLQGYYYCAVKALGWSRESDFIDFADRIYKFDGGSEIQLRKISYLIEFANYLNEGNSVKHALGIINKVKNLISLLPEGDEKKILWLRLQREYVVNLILNNQAEKAYDLHELIFNEVDWGNENQVELYAYIFFSATEKCFKKQNGGIGTDFAFVLQDLAEDYGSGRRIIAFNDKTHYYYLYSKLIKSEMVAISSNINGWGAYGNEVIDRLIEELEGNEMIADFSGLLIGAKALKTGFDDSVTDKDVMIYMSEAEVLLDRYPDNPLLAEKTMELWIAAYKYQYKKRIPHNLIDRSYALTLRFADKEAVLDNFFELLSESNEAGNLSKYLKNKRIMDNVIKFGLFDKIEQILQETACSPIRKGRKIMPNDPCPCGSGKKYKKCCGRR